MANIMERFGILNASEVILFNKSSNKAMLKILQANEMSLEVKAGSKSALEQGSKAITWNLSKEGKLKLKTETTSFAQLAESLGSEHGLVLNTTPENYDRNEQFTVTTDGTIDIVLAHTPLINSVVSFNSLTQDGEYAKELTGVGSAINYTITDATLKVGNVIEVNYIESVVAGGVYTFKVAGQNSGTARKLIANVLCTNRNGNGLIVMQLHIPNVMMEQSLTITCSASDPSKFEISMDVMVDGVLKDADGNPLFFELRSLSDIVTTPTIVPISDLNGSGGALKANLTWTAPIGATSVTLKYKKSNVSSYSVLNTTTTTGVYAIAPLDATSTSVEILGLDANTTYNFKLVYTINNIVYESNIDTEKTTT